MENQSEKNEKYSAKLGRILAATGWTQEELARRLGVSFVSLNGWVNEKAEPREPAREKIDLVAADVLGREAIGAEELKQMKLRATANKCTVNKIVNNREVLEKITTSLTYHSNATEGSTMSEGDVRAVVYENQTLRNRTAVEQREAINHQTALYFLLDELKGTGAGFAVTPDLVRATHLRMMNGIISDAGHYRDHGVRIRGGRVALANFIKIPSLMSEWCGEVNSETTDAIGMLARSHAEFERIHPFSDGNGRTGRLLLFVLALKQGLMPPILKRERRAAYYKYLELAQMRGETDPLEFLLAEAMVETGVVVGESL